MRFVIPILTLLTFGQAWSQVPDDYVKTIEKIRSQGKLTAKTSTDKTFVGSLRVYYDKDSIVLINSLTDAEAAGTEILYFLQGGVLKKVFIIAAVFDSNDEWKEYYERHRSIDKCYSCHGKKRCVVTEVTFVENPTIIVNGKKREPPPSEKNKMLTHLRATCEELKSLAKDLQ